MAVIQLNDNQLKSFKLLLIHFHLAFEVCYLLLGYLILIYMINYIIIFCLSLTITVPITFVCDGKIKPNFANSHFIKRQEGTGT